MGLRFPKKLVFALSKATDFNELVHNLRSLKILFQMPKGPLVQGKLGSSPTTITKGIPQGATIVKLMNAKPIQGEKLLRKYCFFELLKSLQYVRSN